MAHFKRNNRPVFNSAVTRPTLAAPAEPGFLLSLFVGQVTASTSRQPSNPQIQFGRDERVLVQGTFLLQQDQRQHEGLLRSV